MLKENRPIIWKSSVCALFCLPLFFAIRVLSALILEFACLIILEIPVISTIFVNIFRMRGDLPIVPITMISLYFAYELVSIVQAKLLKDSSTEILSREIVGIAIVVFHAISLIVNIILGEEFFVNISCIVTGLIFIFDN